MDNLKPITSIADQLTQGTPGEPKTEPAAPGVGGAAPPDKASGPETPAAVNKPNADKGRGVEPLKPGKSDKPKPSARAPRLPNGSKSDKSKPGGGKSGQNAGKEAAPPVTPAAPVEPPQPREAPRPNGTDQIVYLNISELKPFKNHPFGVRDDAEMKSLAESVRAGGVNQPALVRPIEGGGYEIIAGHRRQKASEMAGFLDMPCIVRKMTDDEAILAMTDDNLSHRSTILPSERAASLKMQVDAIKRQGARDTSGQDVQNRGKTAYDIVGERNTVDGKGISGKQVQRYVWLTRLVPDLMKMADEGKMGFTTAVALSHIKPRNQNLIAVSIESEQVKLTEPQARRMKELDEKGELSGDAIDGIIAADIKEEIKVIITGKELETYFGRDKTPQQMKDQIIKLLDDWAGKEKTITPPEKNNSLEK